jgi:hypothetical protein
MKVRFQISKRMQVEAEGKDVKEVYAELHRLIETFGEQECGCCKSANIKPVARKGEKFTFYEFHCGDCRAKLSLGQGNGGDLYPRRRFHASHPLVKAGQAKDGDYIPSAGWEIYRGKRDE